MHTRLRDVLQNPITRIALMIVIADLGALKSNFDSRPSTLSEPGGQPVHLRHSELHLSNQHQVHLRTDCRLRDLLPV